MLPRVAETRDDPQFCRLGGLKNASNFQRAADSKTDPTSPPTNTRRESTYATKQKHTQKNVPVFTRRAGHAQKPRAAWLAPVGSPRRCRHVPETLRGNRTLSPAFAFSTASPRNTTSSDRGMLPGGISSAFSCTRRRCQSTKTLL